MGNKLTEDGKVKIFGFRSGKSYKMIIAVLYYLIAAFILATSVINEFRYFTFEPIDVVLVIIKYIFVAVFLFSPLIFLSDFNYVNNIPLFKRKEKASSVIGMIIVLSFSYFMIQVNIYCASNVYKASVKEYTLKTNNQAVAPYEKKADSDELKIMIGTLQVAKGYKIEVSEEKDFKKPLFKGDYKKSVVTIKSPNLKNKKKLFVRAKSYGTVNKKTIEGKWSDAKQVTIVSNKKNNTTSTQKETKK